MTTLAERLAKRKNLSPVLKVPFVHSGLYEEYATRIGKDKTELTDEERKTAVASLSTLTFNITRLPQMTLAKVLRDASLASQRDLTKEDGESVQGTLGQASFGARYYEALLNQLVKHITGWSDEAVPFNDANLKAFIETLTIDEQFSIGIQYERAVAEEELAAAANPTK